MYSKLSVTYYFIYFTERELVRGKAVNVVQKLANYYKNDLFF